MTDDLNKPPDMMKQNPPEGSLRALFESEHGKTFAKLYAAAVARQILLIKK